jgi:hypothetical protein
MSYNRSETVDPSAGGDTVKEAILDLDSDMDNIFTYLNTHEGLTGGTHGVSGTLVGTTDTQTLENKTLTAPDINGGTVDLLTALTIANNVDVGDYQIRAKQFYADVPIGTPPLLVTSTTVVANLNADQLDGQDAPTGTIVGHTDTQTLSAKTLTSPVLDGTLSGTAFLDEDAMGSDSATKVASQQSIKKYVDDNKGIASLLADTTPQLGGNLDLNTHSITFPTTAGITDCLDEDDMATDSATVLATQQSIKKYVDDSIGTGAGLPTSDLTANGDVLTGVQIDINAFGFGATLRMDSADGNFDAADANFVSWMPVVALALEVGTGAKDILIRGYIRDDTWSWTPGGLIYASTAQGDMSQTAPSGSGDQVQVIGWAWSATIMVFDPSLVLVEI